MGSVLAMVDSHRPSWRLSAEVLEVSAVYRPVTHTCKDGARSSQERSQTLGLSRSTF